ncbi:MAG: thioredoxin 1 [Gammaproteobacteria bacterium]|jgi:thioredoxin 1
MFWNKKKDKPKALEITDANFNEYVETDQGILLDFYASWCGPCQVLGPIIDELSVDFKDRAVVAKVNVDQNPNLTAFFKVKSMPTLIFIKNKQVLEQIKGMVPKPNLEEMLEDLIVYEFDKSEEEE